MGVKSVLGAPDSSCVMGSKHHFCFCTPHATVWASTAVALKASLVLSCSLCLPGPASLLPTPSFAFKATTFYHWPSEGHIVTWLHKSSTNLFLLLPLFIFIPSTFDWVFSICTSLIGIFFFIYVMHECIHLFNQPFKFSLRNVLMSEI